MLPTTICTFMFRQMQVIWELNPISVVCSAKNEIKKLKKNSKGKKASSRGPFTGLEIKSVTRRTCRMQANLNEEIKKIGPSNNI